MHVCSVQCQGACTANGDRGSVATTNEDFGRSHRVLTGRRHRQREGEDDTKKIMLILLWVPFELGE